MKKIVGVLEGEESLGYLADIQNTSLYLVSGEAKEVYRKETYETVLALQG